MNKLPDIVETFQRVSAMPEAKEILDRILERKQELEDYVAIVQPLLYTLSMVLYADNNEPVSLQKIINDGIEHLNKGRTLQ